MYDQVPREARGSSRSGQFIRVQDEDRTAPPLQFASDDVENTLPKKSNAETGTIGKFPLQKQPEREITRRPIVLIWFTQACGADRDFPDAIFLQQYSCGCINRRTVGKSRIF